MSNILLNISASIPQAEKERLLVFSLVAQKLGVDYLVVGATARDLVMVYAYGASIQRATNDMDFAIQLKNWEDFQSLKMELLSTGYRESGSAHRLYDNKGGHIDLIPFGDIAEKDNSIAWPPDGNPVMNVLGFKEASEHSIPVCISNNPDLIVPVVRPEGFVLLKLIAWSERAMNVRKKDAQDILFLLNEYHLCPEVSDIYYSLPDLIEEFDGHLELACAYLLGQAVRRICRQETEVFIRNLLGEKMESLILDTMAYFDTDVLAKRTIFFDALQDGFELRISRHANLENGSR